VEQLIDAIRDATAEATVHLTLRRDDQSIDVEAKLGELSFAP
jgi:hypothetical protein